VARTPGGTVHIGKAAALIVAGLLLGVIVLRDNSSGGGVTSVDADDIRNAIDDITNTTVASSDNEVTTPTTAVGAERDESTVKVIAINASGVAGQAGKATTKLQAAGYNALQAGNATAAVTNTHPASVIYIVSPGYEREAKTLAALFQLPESAVRALPSPSPSPDIKGDVNLVVLVGTGINLALAGSDRQQ
jgi:hypothetical protein